MKKSFLLVSIPLGALALASAIAPVAAETRRPIKVFVIAGDENCLEQGIVAGRTDGADTMFLSTVAPGQNEQGQQVSCVVYKGAYTAGTDYDKLTPETTALIAMGRQKSKRQGTVPTEFPELAMQDGHTTVLRGAVAVPASGLYEVLPGGFNTTLLDGKEVYRREPGQAKATVTPIQLEPKKRYGFTTVFFQKPEKEFIVSQIHRPGALETLMEENNRYAFLRDANGKWTKRNDVVLYDAHPIHNNTRAAGLPLGIPDDPKDARFGVGPDLMLGHVLGDHYEEPVLLMRFATKHPIWFMRGSRTLGHDYLPPSSGGDPDLTGGWDVIHFNFGVWDAIYRDSTSKYFSGHNITSAEDFEKNLRTMVAKMKKTGATLIWGTVTPVWEGEPGRRNADEDAFNKVAEKVMKENGVIIDDLNAEVRRQGQPKSNNVHDVGNLAPQVTKGILDAIAARKQNTKPIPRVLLIGDSITGTYLEKVTKNLDGKAAVFKNPGNAEDTWNGLEKIDQWLDLKTYLQSGQEYLELVNAVNDSLKQLPRFCPSYQNQGAQIAGLFWIQGIADSDSPAHTEVYEKNLASLIRDLRKDLHAPQMPVVVAAMKFNHDKIHTDQMAVADPAKYPEFAGNVMTVDTRPLHRSGDPRTFGNNAESFLDVGNAMARGMLDLMKNPQKTNK